MPYYNEVFIDGGLTTGVYTAGAIRSEAKNNMQSYSQLLGYRSRYPKAPYFGEYYEHEVDPYRHFITGVMDRRRPKGYTGPIDRGHPFTKTDRKMIGGVVTGTARYGSRLMPGYPRPAFTDFAPLFPVFPNTVGGSSLEQFAQAAFSSSVPRQSAFDGATFLGELREGLPSLPLKGLVALKRSSPEVLRALKSGRLTKDAAKQLGDNWVNLQFALLPFVSEVWKLVDVLFNFDKKYREAIDRVSVPIHRERFAPTVTSQVESPWTNRNIPISTVGPLSDVPPTGRFVVAAPKVVGPTTASTAAADIYALKVTTVERWFEGSFATFYSYPSMSAPFLEKAVALLGVKPSIETFWELAPWSWLVDWLFSIQSTIAANSLGGNEQILMNYGYAMEKYSVRILMTGRWTSGALSPFNAVYESTRKRRIRANPFGFTATSPAGLSAKQWSILAALGANRL